MRRDFHFVLGSNNPTLNRREDNPLCLQINWEENAVAVEKWKMVGGYHHRHHHFLATVVFIYIMVIIIVIVIGSTIPSLQSLLSGIKYSFMIVLDGDVYHNISILQGKTGFPFIDAIMRQLQQEGWIPSLARQIVGSFLTQGCMWISWEEGFKVKNIQIAK